MQVLADLPVQELAGLPVKVRAGRLAKILSLMAMLCCSIGVKAAETRFSGAKAFEYTRQFVAIGSRTPNSAGHIKAEAYLRQQFVNDKLEEDAFTATDTPIGNVRMHNFIVRFPGKKDGIIVLATHYETNYPLRNIGFVGANDGGATTGLLLEIANHLRGHLQDGYSVWLVFFDGEEALESWTGNDNTYGSRHLAAKWAADGTLKKIKGFLLADMIGDRDLNIQRDTNSTPWMLDLVKQAATRYGYQSHFYATSQAVEDDHIPFVRRGVPCADVIDIDYGPHDASHPDGWHHTAEDTLDKVSPRSLAISGDTLLESIRLLDAR